MKEKNSRLGLILFLFFLLPFSASAQTDTIRYVKMAKDGGKYANDGLSWDKAKDNVQDAINDLYDYMQRNNLHSGSVYVAGGKYEPSESTGDGAKGILSTSFKIYDGIHLYGGFNPTTPETTPDKRMLSSHPAWRGTRQSSEAEVSRTFGEAASDTLMDYDFKYATVLSGNHNSSMETTFKWNDTKKQFDTRFPGNSYHVVWFATKGFISDANKTGYADSLVYGASLDGFVIQEGNASGKTIARRDHTTMGGGAYMVKHATIRNSVIRNCSASRRGGGVYMDNGGTLQNSLVYSCQTLGLGIIDGYGGGLCVDNDGAVKRVLVTNNVGRIGGGAAIIYEPDSHPRGGTKFKANNFAPYIADAVVANNTGTTEGGGVLLYKGGVMNHCTIVNNDCPGTDIVISNVRYGRSGGLFINGAGQCFNSVLWGNTCAADNDMQYASYSSKVSADAIIQRPQLFYTALTNRDVTDWSGTQKNNVYDILKENNDKTSAAANYVLFTNPLVDSKGTPLSGAGHSAWSATGWKPDAKSYIAGLGIQVSSLSELSSFNYKTHVSRDLFRQRFYPVSTLGAIRADIEEGKVVLLAPVDGSSTTPIPTLFVDPNRTFTDPSVQMGNSWDAPMQNISDAIYTMANYVRNNKYTGNTQILVKQGELTTAGPSSYLYKAGSDEADLQSAAIRPLDNMRLYGGYPSQLTGTNLLMGAYMRNPHAYVSRISANVVGQWAINSIHCISISNKSNVVIDGFHLYYGNAKAPKGAQSSTLDLGQQRGAAVIVGNRAADAADRKDLDGIVIRNCVLANGFSGDGGGALSVNAYPKADGTKVITDVQLVNCVVRNNMSVDSTQTTPQLRGIITVMGNSTLTVDHCTITNNVGIPFEATTTGDGTGTIKVYNTAVYANATVRLDDRGGLKATTLAPLSSGENISGSSNLIDLLYDEKGIGSLSKDNFKPIFGNDRNNDKTYPRFVNPTRTIGDRRNEDDVALYGGVPDYEPMDMNPMVNAAGAAQVDYKFDLTGINTRTFGGAPDVGAVEDSKLPVTGTTYYVRTKDTGGDDENHDGKTWATAFATLTKALNTASAGQDIWIAAGTYKEGKTVNMKAGINVYGGFKAYGNPGKREGERDISNLKSEYQTILDGESNEGNNYRVVYGSGITTATTWEGLTIQNGSLTTNGLGGGAYLDGSGIKMKNCLIRKNYVYAMDYDHGGGGLYMKGCIVENSIIRNNMVRCNKKGSGAGVYMTGATLINSLIVENHSDKDHPGTNILGSALYIGTKSDIYDCTIAYNQGYDTDAISPVWDNATRASGNWVPNASRFYNTIFWSNFGYGGTGENYNTICRGWWKSALGVSGYMFNCYHSVPRAYYANEGVQGSGDNKTVSDPTRVYNTNNLTSVDDYTVESINNYYTLCKAQDLFNESQYSGYPDNSATSKLGYIETDNPYSINSGSDLAKYCINMGEDDGTLKTTYGITEDIAGADRIQDCSIDKGAYEFNGASEIKPEETTEKLSYYETTTATAPTTRELPVATYYVTQNGNDKGNASADSPDNAACGTKLQQVLDAAGRYKYDHPTAHVIVKLAKYDGTSTGGGYAPSRTTVYEGNEDDNPRMWSLQVPRGVVMKGGWSEDFKSREPLNNRTLLTGVFQSGDQTVNAYHVVTFTDRVFDENGRPMTTTTADGTVKAKLLSDVVPTSHPDWVTNSDKRPITPYAYGCIDGVFIENGEATGTLPENQRGGAAVVPSFGYLNNCVIQNNKATAYGGAVYLESGAMIAGCVIQNNTSDGYGGGIAVEEPDKVNKDTYPYIIFCTVTKNESKTRGGGLYFQTNLRSVCNVYWLNQSNDQGDVSGVTNVYLEQNINNYPINYSAVTNTRVAGVNNISVGSSSDEAVRWVSDKGKTDTNHPYQYYGISKSSVLARAGLPYDTYRYFARLVPGSDSLDIAGVPHGMKTAESAHQQAYDGTTLVDKNNYNVDIGARAINANFDITQNVQHLFYRLFVVHTNSVNTAAAKVLQASGDEIYSQQGSSVANPFLRVDDALRYVVNARNNSEEARNHRFTIFLAGGTYYPYTDLYGTQGHVRTNTFGVPEGVTIIGGLDVSNANHYYCQSRDEDVTVKGTVDGTEQSVTLKGATIDNIRLTRARYDMNKNSLVEPWEMKSQTILSGYAVGDDSETKNVYHVITCNADPNSVGRLPDCTTGGTLNTSDGSLTGTTKVVADSYEEDNASKMHRAIIIDGITVTQGSAKDYEVESVKNRSWYFKGGGIFVSGDQAVQPSTFKNDNDNDKGVRNIPLVVSNCLFVNNNARLGGAIYTDGTADIVGCSFVQNESLSPDAADAHDCEFVTYSGGGAIATDNALTVVNTIFANNEAKRGSGTILTPNELTNDAVSKPANTTEAGKTGDELKGFGGVIWAGDDASVTLMNCNSVKNKAFSYPSVYNTKANTEDNLRHFGLNCIFWGNEADTKDGGDVHLMNYGSHDNPVESLFFSAYEEGHGLPVRVDNNDYRQVDVHDNTTYSKLFTETFHKTNNNVIINGDNDAVDGPNFISPSQEAGYDGYMQSADWLVYRVNNLTDAGWGELDQNPDGTFKTDDKGNYTGHGIYVDLAQFYNNSYGLMLLPLGEDKYMNYADNGNEGTRQMHRISPDPLGTVTENYIDIGVYEYQHTQLHVENGSEADVIWVAQNETTGQNDGTSQETPTSDLQRAIETLLLSRNDHPKVVKIIGADEAGTGGVFTPIYQLDDNNVGFQIHTGANTSIVALKKTIISGHSYEAKSLTIEGGYAPNILGLRDPEAYPVKLVMDKKSYYIDNNVAHLFLISDAEQWGTQGNLSGGVKDQETTVDKVTKSSLTTGQAMPVTFDGLTFVNSYANARHTETKSLTGGAAIYYKEQFKTEGGESGAKSTTTRLVGSGVPKLTIRNCVFQQNGADGATTVPAVRIEQGGGRTLIYNSVFHSGSGNPLECTDTVSIVNCTFAMNGGHIKLSDAATGTSSLYNSIIWQDDRSNSMKTQYEGFTANNVATDSVQYNAITGIENTDEDDTHLHNVGLDSRNYNAMEGPNFVNGDGKDISQRDYHINPGVRTLTRANYVIYAEKVLGWKLGQTIALKDGTTAQLDSAKMLTLLADTAYTKDLANKVRLYDGSMERGAYECSSAMQRVLFVNPSKVTGKMTGLSWENAYGSGMVQRAVDAAAVYTYFNSKADVVAQAKSYVFVKGAADNTVPEAITLRNGVSVYGSVAPSYTEEPGAVRDKDTHEVIYNNGARLFENDSIAAYINKVKASRPGLAAKTTNRTRVAGINTITMKTGYGFGALVDGVEVRSDKDLTAPAIDITDQIDSLVLRNVMIDGNTVNADDQGKGHPVVNLQHGLLYNALLYGNKVAEGQPIASVSSGATMLNCTVATDVAGQKTVSNAGKVINCIDYNSADKASSADEITTGSGAYTNCYAATGNPFAPYLTTDNAYKLPEYLTDHAPYYYQLHESSLAINADKENFTLPERFKEYVNLASDRDVLGNPRTLGGKVDMGCFETWRIADGENRYADAKNNRYPHEGSVVYIGKNASLSLGSDATTKVFTGENAFRPGYLLLKPGASLYGNVNIVQASYVAAERTFPKDMQYTLISMPFPYDYANALTTATDKDGNLTETKYTIPTGKTYNGETRSAWDYDFHTSDSPCWEQMSTTQVAACDGWLLNLGSPLTEDVTVRFTGFGSQNGDYVYTEDENAKTVTLTQYNKVATDGSAHFTKLENMGWNLKGMPWLVSGYNTAHSADGKSCDMSAPHVFYTVSADGNSFATSQSWKDGSSLDFGSAFFTQTAIIGDGNTEKLSFAVPLLPSKAPAPAAKPFVTVSDDDGSSDAVEVVPGSMASIAPVDAIETIASISPSSTRSSKALAFSLGSDGVKWQSFNDSVPQVYLLDNSGVALSLAGNAPEGVEMMMGYRAAKAGALTVSLPDAEAFDGQSVWLRDKATGEVTDLTQSSYTLQASKGYTDNRLTLQIGGVRPDGTKAHGDEGEVSWTVRVADGCLQVRGIESGDLVIVRALSGLSVTRGRATSDTFVTQPLVQGVYIVTVNNRSKKVAVHTRL